MKNSNVSENDNKSKLNSLYEQIIEHNKKYHQDDNPSIPDANIWSSFESALAEKGKSTISARKISFFIITCTDFFCIITL